MPGIPGRYRCRCFEDFIEQLLHHCNRWPEPRSVLIMDNASFHRTEKIQQMCSDSGVKLIYPPPYSLDLNPIEEFFSELKQFIKRKWNEYEVNPTKVLMRFSSGVLTWLVQGYRAQRVIVKVNMDAVSDPSLYRLGIESQVTIQEVSGDCSPRTLSRGY